MAYQKSYKRVNWQNLPSKKTAISAENLNSMDSQIDKNETDIIALKERADEHDSTLTSHKKALENDAFNIKNNTANIKTNADNIAQNTADIAKNTTAIQTNAKHIDSISETIAQTYATKTELDAVEDKIPDVSGFATTTYVDTEIAKINGIEYIKVQALPEQPTPGHEKAIYLIQTTSTGSNLFDEYIWFENRWELFGTAEIDLSDYYTKEEVDDLIPDISGKLDSSVAAATYLSKTEASSTYATKSEIPDISGKLDKTEAASTYMTKTVFNNAISQLIWWGYTNTTTSLEEGSVDGINIFSTNPQRMPKECTSLDFNKVSQYATMIYFKSPNYKVGLYIDVFAKCAVWSGDRKVWKYITETS